MTSVDLNAGSLILEGEFAMKTLSWKSVIAAAGIAVLSQFAAAEPIGPDCAPIDTCNGGIYTLSYDGTALVDADPLHETYRITLSIDTSGVNGVVSDATAIDAVAIKVSSSVFDASLFSAPVDTANWVLVSGGINADGCSVPDNGFECADWIASGVGAAIGGTLNWIFDMTVDNGTLFTNLFESSIKARYVDSSGAKIGDLVSENITLQSSSSSTSSGPTSGDIPEPNSSGLVFLGLGAVLASFVMRRRASSAN